jgi:hypothetical protein
VLPEPTASRWALAEAALTVQAACIWHQAAQRFKIIQQYMQMKKLFGRKPSLAAAQPNQP